MPDSPSSTAIQWQYSADSYSQILPNKPGPGMEGGGGEYTM